jgi:hypothetical protein
MKISAARLDRIRTIRDRAIEFVKARGAWQQAGDVRLLVAAADGVRVSYRTPFQRLPADPTPRTYTQALVMQNAQRNLPYGLDIWAPTKVLNVEWSDTGQVEVFGFKPGAWEEIVLGFDC